MDNNFWKKLPKPLFALAPMADVTDWPFRQVIAQCGRPDVFYTEFVSADGLASEKGQAKLLPLLYHTSDESPIVAQIFGARPENIYKTAKLVQELGFDGLDINMGCPDRKVLKQGAGIALCQTPQLAKEIITSAKEGAPNLPISVKTRLGRSAIDMRWLEVLLSTNVAALAVHLRTAKEMSKVPAHWELAQKIAEIAHKRDILVICNGDVMTRQNGAEKARQYGIDGIMIGRGIFQNPWLFIETKPQYGDSASPKEKLELLEKHVQLFVEFWSRPPFSSERLGRNFDVLKKFIKMYVNNWEGAGELRVHLMAAKNANELVGLIDSYWTQK